MALIYDVPRWDARQWNHYLAQEVEAQECIRLGTQKIFSFADFGTEVFHRLYSAYDEKLIDKPKPEAAWALKLHEELSQNAEFLDLQTQVQSKYYLSGLAANVFIEEISKQLPEPQVILRDPHELRQQVLGMLRRLKQQQRQPNQKEQKLINSLTAQGKKAVASAEDYAQQVEKDMSAIVAAAIASAEQAVNKLEQQMYGFGWGLEEGSPGYQGSPELKLKLAQLLSKDPRLAKITQQAGRMKRVAARKQKAKTIKAETSITGVETGANLARVLSSQLLGLKVPALKPLFIQGIAEESLLQYQMGGKQTSQEGPIVFCVDESGSMKGENDMWAKALFLTMLGIAIAQKRRCKIVHFNTDVAKATDFDPSQPDQEKLINALTHFSDGGTSWEPPLAKAVKFIEQERHFKNADIVFLTDDDCSVKPLWLDWFNAKQQELGFTVYGVAIKSNGANLRKFIQEEHLTTLQDLSDIEAISQVLSI